MHLCIYEPVYNFSVAASVAQVYENPVEPAATNDDFITQTVYGFLDFTTTIGNTVMVFSPQSAPPGEYLHKSFIDKSD